MIPKPIQTYFNQLRLPAPDSHKGQNGKLLIIGGSDLFHAASRWSLDIASKLVDMVFYSSVPQNNKLVSEAKANFWNGIVVPRNSLQSYLQEADCVLIGPGMDRSDSTAQLVNELLERYPQHKWVVDAGALQMVDPHLLTRDCIITPHSQELYRLAENLALEKDKLQQIAAVGSPLTRDDLNLLLQVHDRVQQATMLYKGPIDYIITESRLIEVEGGNAGMTKGGTGDVLAGLVAALYCTHDAATAAVVGSYVNKKAGERLYQQVGPYFNASELVRVVPETLWRLLQLGRV